MRKVLATFAALAAGCSVIGHEPVAGWPALEIVEHHVPHAQMRDRCARYVGFGSNPEACAEFDLAAGKCHIWFSADFPPQRFIVQHERLHCAGYDHIGSTAMQRYLGRYQAAREASAAAGSSATR
jgi:hypothetical protein